MSFRSAINHTEFKQNVNVSDGPCECIYRQQCVCFMKTFQRPRWCSRSFRKRMNMFILFETSTASPRTSSNHLRNRRTANHSSIHTRPRDALITAASAMGIATAIAVAMPMALAVALAMVVRNSNDHGERHGERHGGAIASANVAASESCFTTHLSQPIMSTRLVHK